MVTESNITAYVRAECRGFDKLAVNDVDLLVFSALAYGEYERVGSIARNKGNIPLSSLGAHADPGLLFAHDPAPAPMVELLNAVMASPRFCDVRLEHLSWRVDEEKAVQFGAMCFALGNGEVVVAFRGTMEDFAGWQEDFEMSWLPVTGGQKMARTYLERASWWYPNSRVHVCGHSKGGVFAEYAALMAGASCSCHIGRVRSFDGPALTRLGSDACPEYRGYDSLIEQLYETSPHDIVRYVFPARVGLMLEGGDAHRFRFVETPGDDVGHHACSALVRDGEIVTHEPTDKEISDGMFISRWVRSLSLAERRYTTGALMEISKRSGFVIGHSVLDPLSLISSMTEAYGETPASKKRMVHRVLLRLLQAFLPQGQG